MNENNLSSWESGTKLKPLKKNYAYTIAGLSAILISAVMWWILVNDKMNSISTIQTQSDELTAGMQEKIAVLKKFDASLAKLDSLTGVNNKLQDKLVHSNEEIDKIKSAIRSILNAKSLSDGQLANARQLVDLLQAKTLALEEKIVALSTQNKLLQDDKKRLTNKQAKLEKELASSYNLKQALEKQIDIGSTVQVSNIMVIPVDVKRNGSEKPSVIAKRVDKFIIRFDICNRISQAGTKELFLTISGPDGKPLTSELTGGVFRTRDDSLIVYSTKVTTRFEADRQNTIEFAFVPPSRLQQGDYTLQLFQNGFMIWQGTRQLRKNGLFG